MQEERDVSPLILGGFWSPFDGTKLVARCEFSASDGATCALHVNVSFIDGGVALLVSVKVGKSVSFHQEVVSKASS